MRKLAGATVVAFIAILGLFITSPAQAYNNGVFSVHVNQGTIVAGHTFSVNGHSQVPCDWTITFNGVTQTATGKNFHVKFTAPTTTHKQQFTGTVTCNTGSPRVAGHIGTGVIVHDQTFTKSFTVTVVPAKAAAVAAAGPSNGALPNTGGPDAGLLGGGIALLLVGAGTVFFVRRRQTQHV